MEKSAAAPAGTAVCIEIIGGSEIKTEPLDAIPEHSTDDGVLIEPPQQHVFLRPFPPITSQPVVITEKKANRVRHAAVAAAAAATATATASSASGTYSTSVVNTEVSDFSTFAPASATPNLSTSTQVIEAEIAANFHLEEVSTSGSPSIGQMEQRQPNTSAEGRAGSAAFFRRKKAIPIAVAKKIGSSKGTKTVPSKVTTPTEENAILQIERDADESRPSPDQMTEVKQTVQESDATTAASMTTEQTLQPAKDEQRMQQPNAKPVAFRRVKPKVSILPTPKTSKSTLRSATESKNEPSPLVTSIESNLNEPQHGKEGKEMVVSTGDKSKQAEMDLSKEPVTTIQQDQTIIDQEKITNENNTSLKDTQSIIASLDQPVNEIELDAAPKLCEKQVPQHSSSPDPHNDKENLRVTTTVPPETPKSTSMEEHSSQPVAVTPVAPGKTIKRTIKLGSLPLDLARQLKSAIGIGKRTNAKLTPGMSGEKKSLQPVQRSDDVKVASIDSIAAADTKLLEVDLRHDLPQRNASHQLPEVDSSACHQSHRPSEEPTEPTIVALLSSVEESFSSTQTSVTTRPLLRPSNDDCVASSPLEDFQRETEQIDFDDASESMKPCSSSGEASMQLVKANDTEHVPSVTPAEAVGTVQQPTACTKKIKKISYLTPLQQKMLLSSLIKGKPKSSDSTGHQPAPTIDGANAEMATSTEKQPREIGDSISTSAPKPPTVGFTSPERKIKIISHVILPNLKLPSQCHTGVTGGPSKFSSGADQGAPMVHPPSFSTSAFTSTQQYPKLFVIHSTAPVASDVRSAPSTSSTTPQIPLSDTGEALNAGDVPQSSPNATVEKRPEPQGLVLTVLPRPALPQLGVDVPAPSQAAFSATLPGDHRVVPRIVIDKSYVENDSQSSSSCSSFSSPEQAANVSSASKAKRKVKLNRARHGTEGRLIDTANTGPETPPKVMGCSPNTRDKLRERILQNMDRKGPVVLFPAVRHVYSRKPKSAPVPSESVDMGLTTLSGSVETEAENNTLDSREVEHLGTNLFSSAQPVDLRMQPVMLYPLEDQTKPPQIGTGDGVKSEEPLHTEHTFDTRHFQQEGQESLDFYGFSNTSIERDELECDKKIRAIEAVLHTELIKPEGENLDESMHQEHDESDRSSPVVMHCGIVSDAITPDTPDEREDYTEPLEESIDLTAGDRQTERKSSNLEPYLPPHNAMQSSSSSFEDHRKVEAPCETCTASVALSDRPVDVPVEGIVSSVEHGYVSKPTSFSDTGDNTQDVEIDACEMKDVIELTSADSNVVEENAECSAQVHVRGTSVADSSGDMQRHVEKDNLEKLDKCSVADERRLVADDIQEEYNFIGTTSPETQACTSTIAPLRTSVNTRSPSVPEAYETTGVDLIVAMAMSMKEDEVEDDERSDVDSDCDFGAANRLDEMEQDEEMDVSCTEIVREQSLVSLSRTNKKKRRKKRDKIVELLLRHVNYVSLMGELAAKVDQKKDTSECTGSSSEESDDDESESIIRLMHRIKGGDREKHTPPEEICAQKLSTDDNEEDKKIEEIANERLDPVHMEKGSTSGVLSGNLKRQQTQQGEADKPIVDIVNACSEIKCQEVKQPVCFQAEDDGDGLGSNSMELPSAKSAENSNDSVERQGQNRCIQQTREEPQATRDEANDHCVESCHSFASEQLDGDDHRRDDDELAAENSVICDITDNEEIISAQYSTEAKKSIRSSLLDDPPSCTRRLSVAAVETPAQSAHVATTICDISDNDIVESITASSTVLNSAQGCVTTKTGAAEEANDTESSHKSGTEPVVVELMEASANLVVDTTAVNTVVSVSGIKKGAKKGRKRSNRSSPVDRPAKRKKQLNLLHIKPSSPPVFDSSEAPVANEVVSDCSTDGFSAVDPTSCQELVGTVQKKIATPVSMAEMEAKSGSKAPNLGQKCYMSIPLTVWNANENVAAIKETKNVDSRSTNAEQALGVGKSPVGRGGDGNAQSSGEDDGKGNQSHLQLQTEVGAQKSQRASKQIVSRGNAAHSRNRKSRRSHSSSSSRRSSSGGSNVEAADVSSDDSFRPRVTRAAKRHKLKRKKRSTPRGRNIGSVSAAPNTTTKTNSTGPATSRSTNSSTRRSARCKLSKVSTISKASNTDERYVISEVDTGDEAPQRVLEVVNARYKQVLDMAGTNTRSSVIDTVPLDRLAAPTAQASAIDGSREGALPSGVGIGQSEQEKQSVAAEEQSLDGIDISKQPKRGRPPKPLGGESDESVDESVTEYKCGNCGKEMHRSSWKEHYASHNGVAFRVGIDEPIDLSDIKTVGYAIMRFMRNNRRFEVICEKCGQVKKSFMGMASHLKTCGISKEEKDSAKVACEHCGRKMLIVSIPSHHTLYCRVLREQREKEAAERGESMTVGPDGAGAGEIAEEPLTASGRRKRRAVACAEKKIRKIARETIEEPKELIIKVTGHTVTMGILQCWLHELKETGQATCRHKNCFFVGTSEKKMRTHNDICPYALTAVPMYECAICLCQDPSREVVYEHLRQQHPKELIRTQEQSAPSGDEDDANVASSDMVDGSSGSDDLDLDGDVLDEDDLAADGRKGGRKKKQAPARSKPKKGPPKTPKKIPASKKGALAEDDLQMGVMGEEGEVYKEMVYEEAAEYRYQRANIRFTTIQWMFKFLREQYGTRQLFEQLRPDVDVRFLTMLAIRDYLPQNSQSMRFRLRKIKLYDAPFDPDGTPDGWKRMGTFQGETLDSESMFYCGGPVMALDWLPIPSDCEDGAVDQILAVACKSGYGEFYTCQQLSKRQTRKCLIQIWNIGPLRNASSTTEEPPTKKSSARCKKAHSEYADEVRCPQLSFAIACDFGPIWQLAFCPSGCNNETGRGDSFDRLGLLAATGSDGEVYVFALNRSMVSVRSELPGTKPTPPRIVHLQPVLRLSLTLHQRTAPEPNSIPCFSGHSVMRISWTREKGHTVLAAGYSNGIVAVWKLTSASFSSSLLSASKGGIRTLLPTHRLLHGSGSSITSLDIHYGQSSRFLAVTNADRRVKVYDLHSGHHQPLEVLSVLARSRITAMRWLLHFPVLVFVFDDTFLVDRCGYTVLQPREIGIRTLPLIILGTEATDLAANDWISTNAVTTDGGDLVCHKPIPFVTGIPGKQFGQVLTTTTSVRLNGANASPTIVSSYDEFYESFGLLFSDTDENPAECDRKSLRVKTFRRGNIEQYPAVRLNQIRWNPNSSSFLYYAVGYQAGFVRIRKMPL